MSAMAFVFTDRITNKHSYLRVNCRLWVVETNEKFDLVSVITSNFNLLPCRHITDFIA